MTSVDELFDRFRAAYRAGEEADPRSYLAELPAHERAELDALISAFLATDAGRAYDPASFEAFTAQPRVQETLARVRQAATADWTTLLPAARREAQIRRADLVARLAEALGGRGKERKVARYYHEMEQGSRTARDVSIRVLEALSAIVDIPVDRLRQTGERLVPPAAGAPAAVFARSARTARSTAPPGAPAAPDEQDDWDEIDELFTGGPDA